MPSYSLNLCDAEGKIFDHRVYGSEADALIALKSVEAIARSLGATVQVGHTILEITALNGRYQQAYVERLR